MTALVHQIIDNLYFDPDSRLQFMLQELEDLRVGFDSIESIGLVRGALRQVVVHTVSGQRFVGELDRGDSVCATVWLNSEGPDGLVSTEIAKRHIVAIEHVTLKPSEAGGGGVADGQ